MQVIPLYVLLQYITSYFITIIFVGVTFVMYSSNIVTVMLGCGSIQTASQMFVCLSWEIYTNLATVCFYTYISCSIPYSLYNLQETAMKIHLYGRMLYRHSWLYTIYTASDSGHYAAEVRHNVSYDGLYP